ncbi:Protein of unknown function [Pyronema omphalodes CBS 100304]|uniref:Uncharacterized protein n=1 Tax=Pyronema omphalodes (strain CBS 100304) TaxID=1076935 RepID=U4LGQ9_PYROM|nr:Protein of unknown function [Pyronema omphalodes CBS 100304]
MQTVQCVKRTPITWRPSSPDTLTRHFISDNSALRRRLMVFAMALFTASIDSDSLYRSSVPPESPTSHTRLEIPDSPIVPVLSAPIGSLHPSPCAQTFFRRPSRHRVTERRDHFPWGPELLSGAFGVLVHMPAATSASTKGNPRNVIIRTLAIFSPVISAPAGHLKASAGCACARRGDS